MVHFFLFHEQSATIKKNIIKKVELKCFKYFQSSLLEGQVEVFKSNSNMSPNNGRKSTQKIT